LTGQRESRYGSWGHLESSDQNLTTQPAPKYQVLLDNFRAVQGSCNIDLTVLPLELTDFKAQCTENQAIELIWMTASESNLKNFEVELSYDSQHWQTVEQIDSKGKITTNQTYQYLHYGASLKQSILYYRLKINELDGTTSYSKVISVICDKPNGNKDFSLFPNPTDGSFTVQFHSNEVSKLEFRDMMGRLISVQSVDNQTSMQFSAQRLGLSAGIYYLKTNANHGKMQRLIIL
jgi:hypothetical protein